MAEPIISRDRIRESAQQAVTTNRMANTCPPEFQPFQHVWLEEYRKAIDEAAVGLALQTR